ncbi:hypothetical protein [Enterobacter kobei]|uniref:hypothetical protein n=1 Tax=Enterobacter kobei TaxID=208224 RepID=UPI003CF420A0
MSQGNLAAVPSGGNRFLCCVMKEDESTAIEAGAAPPCKKCCAVSGKPARKPDEIMLITGVNEVKRCGCANQKGPKLTETEKLESAAIEISAASPCKEYCAVLGNPSRNQTAKQSKRDKRKSKFSVGTKL